MRIKITSDSTCDLTPQLIEEYDIGIVPLGIVMGDKVYKDMLEITPDDIFAHVKATGSLCSTSAVNVADYHAVFSELFKEYDAIIHFTISSEMSVCYQNAAMLKNEMENLYVIDSRNLSTGIGHLVLDAAIMARSGMDAALIAEELEKRKEKLNVSFVLDTLNYLYKGGRCSAVAALGANLLRLKPCIEVKNGNMGVGKKYRGALDKCFTEYITDRLKDNDNIDYRRIFITDSGISDELRETLDETVRSCGPFEEIIHTRAGCTISNHCGPNCMGILYYNK